MQSQKISRKYFKQFNSNYKKSEETILHTPSKIELFDCFLIEIMITKTIVLQSEDYQKDKQQNFVGTKKFNCLQYQQKYTVWFY